MKSEYIPASNELRARIILHMDGTVHLCLDDYRTFHCTAPGLMSFMSNPLDFLSSEIQEYESSVDLNPQYAPLDKLPGITLASYSRNGVLSVYFSELLQTVFLENSKSLVPKKLNLSSYLTKETASFNNKTFLLKYFLDFQKHTGAQQLLKQKVSMDEDVFFSIMREIFNSYLVFESPVPPKKALDNELNDASHRFAFDASTPDDSMVKITKYAEHYQLPREQVIRFIKGKQLKRVEKRGKFYYLDINEKPPKPKKERTKQKKLSVSIGSDAVLDKENWPKAKVRDYIVDNKIFSSLIAELVFSKQEVDIYHKICGMREVCWGNQHFLIMPFDFEWRDSQGVSNLDRMRSGKPPMVIDPQNPDAPPQEAHVHHIGQQTIAYAAISPLIHSKYHSIFHPFKNPENVHDAIFHKICNDFWKRYAAEIERHKSFENIKYSYPKPEKGK